MKVVPTSIMFTAQISYDRLLRVLKTIISLDSLVMERENKTLQLTFHFISCLSHWLGLVALYCRDWKARG